MFYVVCVYKNSIFRHISEKKNIKTLKVRTDPLVNVNVLIMKDRFLQLIILGFTLLTTVVLNSTQNSFEKNIVFHGYKETGGTFTTFTFSNHATLLHACSIRKNITIITHGWAESIRSVWADAMIANFTSVRGGCVLFMDYGYTIL